MQRWIVLALAIWSMAFSSFSADSSEQLAAGSYQIRNRKFGELLRPENANNADGTHIVLYPAQPWKCMTWKLLPTGSGSFCLQNHFTSKTFEAKKNDAVFTVVQVPWARQNSNRPAWRFIKLPDGFYRIADERSGNCLSASSKDVITLAPAKETSEQQWEWRLTDTAK